MNNSLPDYSTYHLHELQAALANVDEQVRPGEAELIRGYIEKGGYKYPTEVIASVHFAKRVEFSNKWYKKILFGFIGFLFCVNVLTLLVLQEPVALIPMIFQGGILTAIYWRNRFAKLLIKLWCGVVIFSGAAQFVGMLLLDNVSLGEGLWSFSMLTIGLGFLLATNRYVHLISGQENTSAINK
jgi:hypothetical protein